MQDFVNFSSLPPDQEATFVVFERQNAEAQAKGWTIAGVVSGIFLLFALIVYFGVEPPPDHTAESMDMSRLKSPTSEKAKPADAPAEAPQ